MIFIKYKPFEAKINLFIKREGDCCVMKIIA